MLIIDVSSLVILFIYSYVDVESLMVEFRNRQIQFVKEKILKTYNNITDFKEF